ncbi:hypothetical protein C2845_PM11G06930 [Panicum miliaceum]|uniref:Uncharacterized protein n=1 Tax=Panicum miliaceum TaxID=4540 RepID=A0A3L6RR93_PANMI|nr:hypothetical protein C2845_PM11G06930 [Panicum miliaceum]
MSLLQMICVMRWTTTRDRDIREAIRASRKRRGVAEQVPGDEDGNDSTQIGSNAQNTTGRNRTPRGSNTIPPAPTTHAAKIVLIPSGDSMQNFNKKDRVPNTIIGALLKHHYPQIVYDTTERPPKYVAATKWRHWCMKGPQDNTCVDRVRSDFLARYRWPDDASPEQKDKFMKTLDACCAKLTTQEIYDLRIYAVVAYKTEIMNEITEFEDAKLIHLDAHEYREVPFSWINIDAWNELSIWWGSEEFKAMSALKRAARLSRPESVNCGGSSSVTRTQQCLEETYGRPFSLIEGFAVHMGASKQAVAQGEGNELPPLANDRAQEHLDKYRDAMKEAHGENIPWVKVPLDPQVMYKCTGRKPHGKFAIADGAIDSSQFMRQGCPDAPPPQIDLASLFQNPVPPTSEPDIMDNNSVNATMRHMSGTPSGHVGQQPPPNIYRQQGGTDINSVNGAPRQMNGNSYEHLTGQAFQMPYQQDGTRNNSGSVDLQRMDGSTFRYLARQNTFQLESMQPSIRDQGTPTTNYHSSHMRDNDTTDNGGNVFF